MSLSFENVLDDSLFLFLENWSAFAGWIDQQTGGGSNQVKMDLGKRQVTFLPKLVKRNEVVVPLHLMATINPEGLATWAWANPEQAGAPVTMLSTRVRDFGAGQGIPFFSEPSHTVDSHAGGGIDAHALALAATSCRITGMPVAHLMPVASGDLAVLALDPAGFFPPAASTAGFATLLEHGRASGLVNDARRAVQGYAQARGLGYQWGPDFRELDLSFPDGGCRVSFDDQGEPHLTA